MNEEIEKQVLVASANLMAQGLLERDNQDEGTRLTQAGYRKARAQWMTLSDEDKILLAHFVWTLGKRKGGTDQDVLCG